MQLEQFLAVIANIVTTVFGYAAVHSELKKFRHEVTDRLDRVEDETAAVVIVLRERIAKVEALARANTQ